MLSGVPQEVLLDNDRGLVSYHDRETREVEFNAKFLAFARHWGFRPRACAPYRARTKGKDERGVAYAKKNAIAGRSFESWASLEAHLDWWSREIADKRVHGTTGEVPIEHLARAEASALKPASAIPPFQAMRAAPAPPPMPHGDRRPCCNRRLTANLRGPGRQGSPGGADHQLANTTADAAERLLIGCRRKLGPERRRRLESYPLET